MNEGPLTRDILGGRLRTSMHFYGRSVLQHNNMAYSSLGLLPPLLQLGVSIE